MNRRFAIASLLAGTSAALAPRFARGRSDFPERPIRIIVPVAPGGGAGNELKAHKITIKARMMVPTRLMNISTRCHNPMTRLRKFGQ